MTQHIFTNCHSEALTEQNKTHAVLAQIIESLCKLGIWTFFFSLKELITQAAWKRDWNWAESKRLPFVYWALEWLQLRAFTSLPAQYAFEIYPWGSVILARSSGFCSVVSVTLVACCYIYSLFHKNYLLLSPSKHKITYLKDLSVFSKW